MILKKINDLIEKNDFQKSKEINKLINDLYFTTNNFILELQYVYKKIILIYIWILSEDNSEINLFDIFEDNYFKTINWESLLEDSYNVLKLNDSNKYNKKTINKINSNLDKLYLDLKNILNIYKNDNNFLFNKNINDLNKQNIEKYILNILNYLKNNDKFLLNNFIKLLKYLIFWLEDFYYNYST